MKMRLQRPEQGFAMIFEVILLAVVVTALAFTVYRFNHRTASVANVQTAKTALSAADLVNTATLSEASTDASISQSADSITGELQASDTAAANLAGGIDANSF